MSPHSCDRTWESGGNWAYLLRPQLDHSSWCLVLPLDEMLVNRSLLPSILSGCSNNSSVSIYTPGWRDQGDLWPWPAVSSSIRCPARTNHYRPLCLAQRPIISSGLVNNICKLRVSLHYVLSLNVCKTVMLVFFIFQGKSLKAMVALNSNGPLNWRNETNCGKPDIMLGMLTWLLDQAAR